MEICELPPLEVVELILADNNWDELKDVEPEPEPGGELPLLSEGMMGCEEYVIQKLEKHGTRWMARIGPRRLEARW